MTVHRFFYRSVLLAISVLMAGLCQASEIERRFEAMSAAERTGLDGPLSARAVAVEQHFGRLVAAAANEDASLTARELALLLRATRVMQLYRPGEAITRLQRRWVNVLASRQQAQPEDWRVLFEGLMAARHFEEAAALRHRHPAIGLPPPPSMGVSAPLDTGRTPVLRVDGTRRLVREGIDLAQGRWLVVVSHPACAFSNRAAAFLSGDRAMKARLARARVQMLWLVPVETQLDLGGILAWQQAHPALSVAITERQSDWPAIGEWDTPNVYLFDQGQRVGQFTGWKEDAGPRQLPALLAKLPRGPR